MTERCYHCFQPVPQGLNLSVEVLGEARPMCCYGCQAVAQTIVDNELENFYRFRNTDDEQAIPLIPDELLAEDLSIYDHPEAQKEFVATSDKGAEALLAVEGMTCAACAWLIEKQVSQLAGVDSVQVNSATDRVRVHWQLDQVPLSQIISAIHHIGYRARPFQEGSLEEQYKKRQRSYIRRLGVAGIASMQTMMVAFGLYFDDIDATSRLYFWWVSLVFTAPVFVYSCQPFYQNAWRALKTRTLNMDVPVSLAIIFAFFASLYATVTDQGEVYYECVTMFAFFLLSGRYLELVAKQKAITDAANLVKLIPQFAERKDSEAWQQVNVSELVIGDMIRVKPGAVIPIDGALQANNLYVNEAQLTGESRPVYKVRGDMLYAGSINLDTPAELEVTQSTQNTLLSGILRLQDEAFGLKPRFINFADRISKNLVLATLIIASLTYFGWLWVEPERAFWVVLSVLVATCPCALSLAAPTAVSSVVSRLNRRGILLKQANALAVGKQIKTICFDKTGTLTQGRFSIVKSWFAKESQQEALFNIACELEAWSEHPIAQAFPRPMNQQQFTGVTVTPGAGVEGTSSIGKVRIGSPAFINAWHPELSWPLHNANVILASESNILAAWRIDDEMKEDAPATVDWLRKQGYKCMMLTGDSEARAALVADACGIETVYAALSPAQKLERLREVQQVSSVLMVGDGINDAPVLAGADVSVTFAAGTELAQASSDVVILNSKLAALRTFFTASRQLNQIIRQNFIWAFGYNAVILPLAVLGYVDPLIAMLGMSLSSLIVISNSLRLLKHQEST
ncbi:MAG: cbb3-type cytochrome c oxidase biogenesis Cu2+ exporting ATPase CcoI [Idiomarinaceae bacterium HL-53]|nr:MAG: cbb3-type cytochrome c oxidase biogenesis Cu2+ exporting ATPase CcoI [Idiomarinaceae bacterium HL-53]CUS48984.1 Cu2+-exporting ATPase [Idiomarinaceae bacterium HL-53]